MKILNFVKRNLTNCSTTIKKQAYLALVRPIMEYASPVWHPYYNSDIYKLEKVQRRAARSALSDYSRESSVTSLLSSLKWPTLQQCRLLSRLLLFYKIFKQQIPVTFPPYYLPVQYHTRQYHQDQSFHSATDHSQTPHKYSFYPRTIRDWNSLPISLFEARDVNEFVNLLSTTV